MTGVVEDTDDRLAAQFVQRIDLALDIFFSSAGIVSRDFNAQFFIWTANILRIIGNSFLNIAGAKVMRRVFEDEVRNGGYKPVRPGSTCQYHCCRAAPGMSHQGGII